WPCAGDADPSVVRRRRNPVDRQVCADELLLFVETQAYGRLERTVNDRPSHQRDDDAAERAGELRTQRDATQTAERRGAEDAGGDATPRAADTVQRPYPEHVVDSQSILRIGE